MVEKRHTPVLHISELTYSFDSAAETTFRKGGSLYVNHFELNSGDLAIVVGENGCGKTTFCKILAGLIETHSWIKQPRTPPLLVWQEQELFPTSVEGNLSLVNPDRAANEQTLVAFDLYHKSNKLVTQLSGGQCQKLAIARARAAGRERDLFIFDEPTQEIDAEFNRQMRDRLLSFREGKSPSPALLVITHNYQLVSFLTEKDQNTQASIKIYAFELVGERYVLKGPYRFDQFFATPPTLFAAQFLGYENFYVQRQAQNIDLTAFRPMKWDLKLDSGDSVIAIRVNNLTVGADQPSTPCLKVGKMTREYREGGLPVTRYVTLDHSDVPYGFHADRHLEFVVLDNAGFPEKGYLSVINPDECVRIGTEVEKWE